MDFQKAIAKYELYMIKQKYADGSKKGYLNDLKMFYSFLTIQYKETKIDIDEVSADDIQEYIDELIMEKKYRTKTISRQSTSIKNFFNYLVKKEYIEKNPYNKDKIELPNPDGKRNPTFLNENQIDVLLNVVHDFHMSKLDNYKHATEKTITKREFLLKRDKAIVRLFIDTGLRVSELTNLTMPRMDLEEKVVDIIGKRDKERFVYLNSDLTKALQEYLNVRPKTRSDIVFVTAKGEAMTERNIQMFIKKMYDIMEEEYGIKLNKPLSPHKLRHTFATRFLRLTNNLRLVQVALGHESVATTQIYAHVENEVLKGEMEKIAQINK